MNVRHVTTSSLLAILLALAAPNKATSAAPAASAGATGGLELRALCSDQRALEPRISGFPFSPLPVTTCTTAADSATLLRLAQVDSQLQRSLREQPNDVATLHERGQLLLLLGRVAEAVELLQRAVAGATDPAGDLLSDLAAAHWQRSQEDSPFDLVRGLLRSDEALARQPSHPEALFNRALLLQSLYLRPVAIEAWEAYLTADSASLWANEARERIALLQQPNEREPWEWLWPQIEAAWLDPPVLDALVRQRHWKVRQHVEKVLLPAWARDPQSSDGRQALALSTALAASVQRLSGDALLTEAVAHIQEILSGEGGELEQLSRGTQGFGEARSFLDRGSLVAGLSMMARAIWDLEAAGSPLALRARLHAAIGVFRQGEFHSAQQDLLELTTEAERYPLLVGRLGWMIGLCLGIRGQPRESLVWHRQAALIYARGPEVEAQMAMESMLAEGLEDMGQPNEAWRHVHRALSRLPEVDRTVRRLVTLSTATQLLLLRDLPEIALYFQDLAVEETLELGDPLLASTALQARAQLLLRVDRLEEAARDVKDSRYYAEQLEDKTSRWVRLSSVLRTEGALQWRTGSPTEAIETLSRAIEITEKHDYGYRLVPFYLERSQAHLSMGDEERAAGDLDSGIRLVEQWRHNIEETAERGTYLEHRRQLYDQMTLLQARQGRIAQSFSYNERSRARSLLDRRRQADETEKTDAGAETWPATRIQNGLPEGSALLVYALPSAGNRSEENRNVVLCWLATRDRLQLRTLDVAALELRTMVRDVVLLLQQQAPAQDIDPHLQDLYRHLLAPVLSELPEVDTLLIVPDPALSGVPFAALRNADSGRYLVEDYVLAQAPSASLLMETLHTAAERPARVRQLEALVVGDPAFDAELFPELSPLPAAQVEARKIAALYPRSQLLLGGQATVSHLLSSLHETRVLHFAGHALVNEASPLLSALVLTPELSAGASSTRGSGALEARDLYALDPGTSPDLVVLAACRSGGDVQALTRPFLAAGSSAVVASLWDVLDEVSAHLLTDFHQELRAGQAPATALALAQRNWLAQAANPTPAQWAVYTIHGGLVPVFPADPVTANDVAPPQTPERPDTRKPGL